MVDTGISPVHVTEVVSASSSPTLDADTVQSTEPITNVEERDKTRLKRDLSSWQILMIGLGGVIGITIFSTSGEILHTSGPLSFLVAFCFVAVTTICVLECVAELVVLWPVSNAIIEFVKVFVDEDLGITMGICYWYTFASVFAILIIVASDYAAFWLPDVWRIFLFYAFIPFALLVLNCFGVKVFGWVEGIGGIVKILLVFAGILFMIVDAIKYHPSNMDEGFQHDQTEAANDFVAICICIPLLAYGFIGTEIISVTAFEAHNRASLRFPVRWVAYIISAMYFAGIILQINIVSWSDPCLQGIENDVSRCPSIDTTAPKRDIAPFRSEYHKGTGWWSIMGVAAWQFSKPAFWFFNGCVIYFCLSAANTALYVASRTLFGLTRGLNRQKCPWYLQPFKYCGQTSPKSTVPQFALICSAVAFAWLPFVRGYGNDNIFLIMSTTGAIGGVTVWLSMCVAYVRYYCWFHKLKERGILDPELNRWDPKPELYEWHRYPTLLASLRLLPACLGITGCFLIVFVFSTARLWNGHVSVVEVVTACGLQIVVSVIFLVLKLWNGRRRTRLEVTSEALFRVRNYLEQNSGIDLAPSATVRTRETV